MKKTLATIGGVAAVLALVIPSFARMPRHQRMPSLPDVNLNAAIIDSKVESESNTGDNELTVTGLTPNPCQGRCSRHGPPSPVISATIVSGNAYADAVGAVTVGRQENGCCDEGPTCVNPCRPRCQRPTMRPQTGDIDVNLAVVHSRVKSEAETGDNRLSVAGGSGTIITGNAEAWAAGSVLVNVQVNDLDLNDLN